MSRCAVAAVGLVWSACAASAPAAESPSSPRDPDARGRVEPNSRSGPPASSKGRVGQAAHRFFLRTQNPERSGLERLDLNRWVGPGAEAPRTVVLSFAANDCAPCKKELSALTERSDELQATGAMFAVVVMDATADQRAQMLSFLNEQLQVPFPVVVDPPGQIVTRNYGVSSLPHTALVGSDGLIRWVSHGYTGPESLDALFAAIRSAE